jgi:uncharacterized caspase-like protein
VKQHIKLVDGNNLVSIVATNSQGTIESNRDRVSLVFQDKRYIKPNLYIFAIGIDKYRDGDLWLKYSLADAKDILKTIPNVSKQLFKNIYTFKLFDSEVTKDKILEKFAEIGKLTTRNDVFILYVAGHGITDTETAGYFYLPYDFRYKNEKSIQNFGFSQEDFAKGLSNIQALKSLTLLDTCNSGSYTEAMASRGVLQKTAIRKLTRATGRATIVASSKDQVALEGYKGHGVFTFAVLEALKGKGFGNDDKITIKELSAYLEDRVPDLTYEKWGYEQVPQSTINGTDFPIGLK